ncbi:hypothetical protein COV89_03770 [Candidatus Shapirobacteria bacterium CG11_big_fil_rev_8_21_14_0_20_40_12]|uniref:Fibronectin type-III domain-containing protein n=1 Tax=Candidatus Shapirobacteria bacterium CG11_big_fil_rev_8_21_14_0_20_40_12 TaxID=1974889 RepID=A0A2H0KF16_9BACT|nr:MAG: hypothetical protein COV89_03770 [Candidatus Shapirobacteria bacterium CG11_big_fil_rev_8_21_14_0_20_40_12]
MNLKKETIKIKKIPVFAAIFLIITGLAGGVILIDKGQGYFLKASSESFPQQVKITNIDSSSFVVSWITDSQASGAILYGESSSVDKTQKDIRDEEKEVLGNYKIHYVLLDNLKASTKYFFKISSANKSYTQAGKPYEVTTAPEKALPASDIAQGKILTSQGTPGVGAIVYLSLSGAVTQAGLVEENGYWMILLSKTRTDDLQNYLNYDQSAQIEEIFVQAGGQTASAILAAGSDNPAPDIVLGQSYDFIKNPNIPTPTVAIGSNVFPTGTLNFAGFESVGQNEEVIIVYPSEEENINNPIPEFFGTGPKEKLLNIVVESEEKILDETNVDKQGQWKWSPAKPLTPGNHQIKVSYVDKDGFIKTVSRGFIVLAAGTSDLPTYTATPSGEIISPSPTPTLSPTPTEKPSRTTVPSGQVLKSGTDLPTWIFLGGGVMFVAIGLAFLLL